MKSKGRLMRMTTTTLLMTGFLLSGLASLSGCMVTNKILELRKQREIRVKEATNFWSLSAVRSAHLLSGSEVFACVEFRDSPSDAPEAFTVNLSKISQICKTYSDFMPAGYGRTESPRGTITQAAMPWYLYPLLDARKGCVNGAGESPFPATGLKIETVQMHRDDQSRLPAILLSPNEVSHNENRIVAVSFASAGHTAKAEAEAKNELLTGPTSPGDVLLVYLPATQADEQPRALGLAGAFEPGSEWVNPYSLLVAPALATDTAMVTLAILIVGAAYGAHR